MLISKRSFYKSAALILSTCAIFYFLYLANENIKTRYFYVAFFLLIILNTIYLSKSKCKVLLAIEDGSKRSLAIASMKFRAEIAAAFSLLVFFGPYYLTGLELDKIEKGTQITLLVAANTLIEKTVTEEYCIKPDYRKKNCDELKKEVSSLFQSIADGIGEKSYSEIDDINRKIDNFNFPDGSVERNTLNDAITKLKILDLRDWWMTRIFATIPLFASFFASLAVSSKVAVAWAEWSGRKIEQQKKEKKIKAEEESQHKRLMEEAAHKEQLN